VSCEQRPVSLKEVGEKRGGGRHGGQKGEKSVPTSLWLTVRSGVKALKEKKKKKNKKIKKKKRKKKKKKKKKKKENLVSPDVNFCLGHAKGIQRTHDSASFWGGVERAGDGSTHTAKRGAWGHDRSSFEETRAHVAAKKVGGNGHTDRKNQKGGRT